MEKPIVGFDLEKFTDAVEKYGVEKTLTKIVKDLAIMTWKASQKIQTTERKEKKP